MENSGASDQDKCCMQSSVLLQEGLLIGTAVTLASLID